MNECFDFLHQNISCINFIVSNQVYRLLCLMSAVGCNLNQKVFDSIKKLMVETYGFKEMIRIHWMEKSGIIE